LKNIGRRQPESRAQYLPMLREYWASQIMRIPGPVAII
jgi:hypothetical protein